MTEQVKEYLCVATHAYGGGSFARGKGREEQIKRVARIYKEDWKHLFKNIGKKGSPLIVNVIDTTDLDEVRWDDRGFWVKNPEGKYQALDEKLLEVVTHTY
jgi:hypothetical protein